jgi:hypothetical protein
MDKIAETETTMKVMHKMVIQEGLVKDKEEATTNLSP